MTACLCVGGPHDGTWIDVQGEQAYIRRLEPWPTVMSMDGGLIKPTETRYHDYERMRWCSNGLNRYVYVHTSIELRDVLDILLNGYRRAA